MSMPKRPAMVREAAAKGGKKWYLEILIFIGVFVVAMVAEGIPTFVLQLILSISTGELIPTEYPDWYTVGSLFATGLGTVVVILFCRFVQKRDIRSIGFRKERAAVEYLVGAAVGTVLFAAAVLICVLTGSMTLDPQRFAVGVWLLYLMGFLIQGMSEEVICRGYFMVSLARKNHLAVAVFVSSLAFSLMHIFNSGVTFLALFNILLFGVFAALYVLRRGNLWGACAMHSLWNFVQGNVFGISVSGTGAGVSPLAATANEQRTVWNGGAFGAEGGLAVTIVLTVGILLVLFVMKDREADAPQEVTVSGDPSVNVEGYDPFAMENGVENDASDDSLENG